MSELPSRRIASFEDFELDLETGELRRRGESVGLPPQPTRLLKALVEESPGLLARDEIRRRLWGGSWLEWEAGLHQAIRRIRAALGDDASAPRFVETVPRRGYRFIADVRVTTDRPDEGPIGVAVPARWRWRTLIGMSILGLLGVLAALAMSPRTADSTPAGVNAEASRLYREAEHLLDERRPEAAIPRLERATRIAPDWADPWGGLARAWLSTAAPDRVARARSSLEAALARDERNALAWRQLAQLRLWEEWDWRGARRALDHALALEPESAESWQMIASLETVLGDGDAALAAARRAVYLDPVSTARQVDLGWTLYYTGRLGAAAEECARTLDLDRDNASARRCVVQALLAAGHREGASHYLASTAASDGPSSSELDRYFESQLAALERPPSCASSAASALPRLALGDPDGAFDALLEGAREGHGWEVPFARIDPLFARLRERSGFSEIERLLDIG